MNFLTKYDVHESYSFTIDTPIEIVWKWDYFPHSCHVPTSAYSAGQGTNINNTDGGIFVFFQARLFKLSCSKCLVQNMQQKAIFRVLTGNDEWSNNWRKNMINVVTWDCVDSERQNWWKGHLHVWKTVFFRGTAFKKI